MKTPRVRSKIFLQKLDPKKKSKKKIKMKLRKQPNQKLNLSKKRMNLKFLKKFKLLSKMFQQKTNLLNNNMTMERMELRPKKENLQRKENLN